jgi:LPPG:FO 2-phospho-L-lactate transferase
VQPDNLEYIMRIVALAGGVGAAKFLSGLLCRMSPECLTVIVNTGDDFRWMGLHICPDIDTVTYTLAGIENPATGWGIAADTFHGLERLGQLGCETWFRLGDRDLAHHILRTHLLQSGATLSEVTAEICRRNHIPVAILPMTDDSVPTLVETDEGILSFQEYFVRRQAEPRVQGFIFDNCKISQPAPHVLPALNEADVLIMCPSNPFISIGPILAIPGIEEFLRRNRSKVLAISPIVSGRAIKGPAARMLAQLGMEVSAAAVAGMYRHIAASFVLDQVDNALTGTISSLGMEPHLAPTIMDTRESRIILAERILEIVS